MEPPGDHNLLLSFFTNGTQVLSAVGAVLTILLAIGLILHSYKVRNFRTESDEENSLADNWSISQRLSITYWLDIFLLSSFSLLFLLFEGINLTVILVTWLMTVVVISVFHFLPSPESRSIQELLERISSPIKKINSTINRTTSEEKDLIVKELEQVLENSEGESTEEDQKMLHGIVKFSNTAVQQIMTNISEIVAINENDKISEVIALIRTHGFSRIPVFSSGGDRVIGVIHAKDLIDHLEDNHFNWKNLIRAPYFVSPHTMIADLLEEFQQHKKHIAMVSEDMINYLGLVTLEDIIEEIVGDIADEYDDEEVLYSRIDDQNYIFEAKTTLTDLGEIIGTVNELEAPIEDGIYTISGLLISLCSRLPKKNEKITFHNLTFTIEAVDKRHVKRVKITIDK